MQEEEIFEKFIDKAEDIKNTWEIVEIFEEERLKLAKQRAQIEQMRQNTSSELENDIQDYKSQIQDLKSQNNALEEKIKVLNDNIKDISSKSLQKGKEINNDDIQEESLLNAKKIISPNAHSSKKLHIFNTSKSNISDKNIAFPKSLGQVKVRIEDRQVCAIPTEKVYSLEDVKKLYALAKNSLNSNDIEELKVKILDLEFENKKLKLEKRDAKDSL